MTPEQHDRVQSMFLAACLLAGPDRRRYLDSACGDAPDLRREVEELLHYHTAQATMNGPSTLRDVAVNWSGGTDRIFADGTILDGKIRIDGVVGEGGMGTVFRGTQLALDRRVAIKIMRPAFLLVPGFVEHLKREALAIARLRHPNVVAIHDLCSSDEVGAYLVMEFVEGETLADACERAGRLPSAMAVEIVGQICSAVQAMHEVGVIHRDLKPQNILLEPPAEAPRAKVLDFGIAKLVESSPASSATLADGVFVGTPRYASPEQAMGDACDARSDVYSLGCILYEVLTGRPPFAGSNSRVLHAHMTMPAEAPSRHEAGIPDWLDTIVLKTLEKDREARFQSAKELAVALVAGSAGPLTACERPPNNIPAPMTSFVGRESAVSEILGAVERSALVTLTGLGGVGKTRLAVRAATELLDRTQGRAGETVFEECRFVDLAPVAAVEGVPAAVAAILGLRANSERDTVEGIVRHVGSRRVLLVFDNCEHVVEGCATLLGELFGSCAGLRVLATSRVPLRLAGEYIRAVAPLGLPDVESSRDEVLSCESVRLFVDRARLVSPVFGVEGNDLDAVAGICRHLDGLPLAIELAAARIRILTVHQIRDRLVDRLRLLRAAAGAGRHESLRAAIDWSYDLLEEAERVLFERLSVFSGGFTIDAIEAVCTDDVVDAFDALDRLAGLVDKSLVGVTHAGRQTRYFLLETVREYSTGKLAERGATERFRARHREYFLDLAERAAPELHGKDSVAWGARLYSEIDNLRAALAWSRDEAGDGVLFPRLAKALHVFFYERGYLAEGRAWLDAALGRAGDATPVEMRTVILTALGNFAHDQGDLVAARGYQERALEINREGGDEACVASVLHNIGNILMITGDCAGARRHFEESYAICRKLGRTHNIALSLFMQGCVAAETGDWDRAAGLFAESEAAYASIQYTNGLSLVRTLQSHLAMARGEFDRFDGLARDALALSTDSGNRLNVATVAMQQAIVARLRGDFDEAESRAAWALDEFRALGYAELIGATLHVLARTARDRGVLDLAAARLAESLDSRARQGLPKALAECFEEAAAIAVTRGGADRAARLLGAASATRASIGCPRVPVDVEARERERASVREVLGREAFDAVFGEGMRLTLPEAVAVAREALASVRFIAG